MLFYVSGEFYASPRRRRSPSCADTVAVTENGGATIGDDEATIVTRRRSAPAGASRSTARRPGGDDTTAAAAGRAGRGIRRSQASRMPPDVVARQRFACRCADARGARRAERGAASCRSRATTSCSGASACRSRPFAERRTASASCLLEGDAPPRVNGHRGPGGGAVWRPATRSRWPGRGSSTDPRCSVTVPTEQVVPVAGDAQRHFRPARHVGRRATLPCRRHDRRSSRGSSRSASRRLFKSIIQGLERMRRTVRHGLYRVGTCACTPTASIAGCAEPSYLLS